MRWTMPFVVSLALLFASAMPAQAAPRIDGYSPSSAPPGGHVVMRGAEFGLSQGTKNVVLGQGDTLRGTTTVTAWTESQIEVDLPAGIAAGRYWLAIHDRRGQEKARGPETLTVTGSAGGGGGGGGPAPGRGVRVDVLDLAIVSVSPNPGSSVRVVDGQVHDVRVRVRNTGSVAASFRVGSPNTRAPNRSHAISEEYRLEPGQVVVVPISIGASIRGGEIRNIVALGTPGSPLLYADRDRGNNIFEVRYVYEPLPFRRITATLTQLTIRDDCDPHGAGEWYGYFNGYVSDGPGAAERYVYSERWPEHGTRTVNSGQTLRLNHTIVLRRVPVDGSVRIGLGLADCDRGLRSCDSEGRGFPAAIQNDLAGDVELRIQADHRGPSEIRVQSGLKAERPRRRCSDHAFEARFQVESAVER